MDNMVRADAHTTIGACHISNHLAWGFILLFGCSSGSMNLHSGLGDGIIHVNLITEPDPGCYKFSQSGLQRLTNGHPTRRVVVKRMTENSANPDMPRVTIGPFILEPAEREKRFVGCVLHEDGREVKRIIEEAWLYTTPGP